MSFIIGLITGFVLFPVISICAILIYGFKAGWDKPGKIDQMKEVKEYESYGNINYIKYEETRYINKTEIVKLINTFPFS